MHNIIPVESLNIIEMCSGNLLLEITSEVTWDNFHIFADKLIEYLDGSIREKNCGVDIIIFDVIINEYNYQLVFDDFPVMVSLESTDKNSSENIHSIKHKLSILTT